MGELPCFQSSSEPLFIALSPLNRRFLNTHVLNISLQCMTDAFDPENSEHQKCKKGIEIGNGLPDIRTCRQVAEALEAAGFEVMLLALQKAFSSRLLSKGHETMLSDLRRRLRRQPRGCRFWRQRTFATPPRCLGMSPWTRPASASAPSGQLLLAA